MTTPSVPATQVADTDADASWANDVRALLEFLRDDVPKIRVEHSSQAVTSGSAVDVDLDGETPDINVGPWTGSATNDGWEAPEDGVYDITAHGRWAASSATGTRRHSITVNGSAGLRFELPDGSDTSNEVHGEVSDQIELSAGDEIGVEAFQNSGVSIFFTGVLHATWVGASAT